MPRNLPGSPPEIATDHWDAGEENEPGPFILELIRPALFEDLEGVTAAFTTRHGGVSARPFDSLNLGLGTGDDRENVRENRRRLALTMGYAPEQMAVAGQVHGSEVKAVHRSGLHKGCDGLVTRTPGVLLCLTAADCASVLLADDTAGIVGACHSGWRGTAARVAAKTVAAMARLGAEPGRLRAYISPSISADEFVVDEDVAERFGEAFRCRRPGGSKWRVDLKAAIAVQLRQAGVLSSSIEVSLRCTASEHEAFFSYRHAQGRTGRMMGVIGLTS